MKQICTVCDILLCLVESKMLHSTTGIVYHWNLQGADPLMAFSCLTHAYNEWPASQKADTTERKEMEKRGKKPFPQKISYFLPGLIKTSLPRQYKLKFWKIEESWNLQERKVLSYIQNITNKILGRFVMRNFTGQYVQNAKRNRLCIKTSLTKLSFKSKGENKAFIFRSVKSEKVYWW